MGCGCIWDGRVLDVAQGCAAANHESDLGANFPYRLSVPPREGVDGPEGLFWSVWWHGDNKPVDAARPARADEWPSADGHWIWG